MLQVDMISHAPCPLGPEYLDFQDEQPISSMSQMPDLAEYPEEGMNTLLPCISCNRTFNPMSLERHIKVCEKLIIKKRHVFDSTKKRIDDLETPRSSPGREVAPPKVKSRWREKRAEFLRAIRAAKNTSDDSDEENNRRNSIPSDYIQCPFCIRHFGPKSADRHIDWCREQKNRLPKNLTQEESTAVAKMRARTQYIPPRPGHSGWKAPKKKDVISSIPPQNSGANITPLGRLVTPPLPTHRQISPPPISPSRKASSSSLPPGPPRYGTSSLGRSAGKQFATMLQAVTGTPTGYGLSSGYGSTSLYGTSSSPANYNQTSFQRTSSLRIPRKKYGMGQKMARHRDLASDMLASVMGGGGKRLEPEGDEAGSPQRLQELNFHSSHDRENVTNKRNCSKNGNSIHEEESITSTADHDHSEDQNLFSVQREREALDLEINQLEKKLWNTELEEKRLTSTYCTEDDLECSDSDFDVAIEDSFIKSENSITKSSTSVSGDDNVYNPNLYRPRSVHFKDENHFGETLEGDEDIENQSEVFKSFSLAKAMTHSWPYSDIRVIVDNEKFGSASDLSIRSENNESPKKESVREMFKKRREQMTKTVEKQSRKISPECPRNARNYDEANFTDDKNFKQSSHNRKKSDQNTHTNRDEKPLCSNCQKLVPFRRKSEMFLDGEDAGVISSRQYAHLRSLVGGQNILQNTDVGKKHKNKRTKKSHTDKRLEDKPYDPFSAAELQFQSLLIPSKVQRRKTSGLMGSTGSLKHAGLTRGSPERDYGFRKYPKPRSTSLSVGNHTMSMLGLNSYGIPVSVINYSEKDSTENSPIELESPEDNLDILSRLHSAKSSPFSPTRSPYGLSPSRSPSRFSPNRSSPTRTITHEREKSPYKSSPRAQSLEPFNALIMSLEETAGRRKPADGANLNKITPLTQKTYSKKKSFGEFNAPIYEPLDNKSHEYNGNAGGYGWTPDYDGPKSFSRYFGRDNMKDRTSADGMHSSLSSAAHDSLKVIRESFSDDTPNKDYMRFDDSQHRISSGSSTDSSFPPVSSPMSLSSPSDKTPVLSQITRFCHECGHKYPVDMAKFCCQCGIRRINV